MRCWGMLVVPGQVTAMDNNFTFWVFHEPNIGLGRNWFLKMSTLECNNGNWILGMKMRNLCMIYLSNIFLLRIWNQSLYHILFYSMVSLVSPRNTNSVNPRDDGPLDFPPPDEGGCWPPPLVTRPLDIVARNRKVPSKARQEALRKYSVKCFR